MTAFATYTPVGIPRYNFNERHILAAAAYNPGDFAQLADGLIGAFAGLEACAINDPIVMNVSGAFDVLCNATTDTYVDGAAVYFDTTSKVAMTASSGTAFYMGTSIGAKVTGTTRVRVALNGNIAPSLAAAATATTITVSGATTLQSTVAVTGATTFASTVAIAGALSINQTSKVSNTKYLDLGWATLAAGTTGAHAAIVSQTVYCTCSGASNVFVNLPAPIAGRTIVVLNNSVQTLQVFPNASESINNTTSLNIATYKGATFVSDGTNWIAVAGA